MSQIFSQSAITALFRVALFAETYQNKSIQINFWRDQEHKRKTTAYRQANYPKT